MQEADDSDTPKAAPTETLMTARGVLSWIAFGDARALDQILEVNAAWRWRNTDLDRTLASVDAILAGRWVPATTWGTWSQEKRYGPHPAWGERGQEWIEDLRKWISRQDRVDVSLRDLARLLRDEMARQGQLSEALDGAEDELLEALRAQKLTAYGRVNGNDRVPHQPIPFTVFMDGRIHITVFDTVEGEGVGQSWTHVQFQTAEVYAFLQARQSKSPETQEATPELLEAAIVEPKPKHPGGRPPKYDWHAFTREMMRIANGLDGLPDRPTLMRLMMNWCSITWGAENVPAESVVRDRIANLYP